MAEAGKLYATPGIALRHKLSTMAGKWVMAGDLDGLTVVSVEQAVAAPYLSSRLADAGARVINVARPEGALARGYDHLVQHLFRMAQSRQGIGLPRLEARRGP